MVDTEISVSRLPSPVYEGESIVFTVTVADVPSLGSYDLEVTAYGAANTTSSSTNSDIGFNSTCSYVVKLGDVTRNAAVESYALQGSAMEICRESNAENQLSLMRIANEPAKPNMLLFEVFRDFSEC